MASWMRLLPLVWVAADAVRVRTGSAEELEDRAGSSMRLMIRPESMAPTLREPDSAPYSLKYPNATSYSQWRQDITLAPIFRSIGDRGFFVESGAFNGETHSNTLLLEKLGWSGLLIEPEPHNLAVLKRKHRQAHIFEGALSPTGAREMVRFSGNAIRPDGWKSTIDVIAEPLQSLLQALGRKTVDFWSLDIEGFEGPVLNSTDFRGVEVGVLLIEVNHKSDLVEEVMAREGFQFIGNTHYQKSGSTEIRQASPDKPWLVLDAVYVNPSYFKRRSLPVPKHINENLRLYDCTAAATRKERGLAAFKGDAALLKSCH